MGQHRTFDIPLSGGLQEKTAEPYLDGSAQVQATNAIFIKRDAIEKRPGWIADSNSIRLTVLNWLPSSLASAQGLYPSGNGYAVTDGFHLYEGAQTAVGVTWTDFVSPCVGTRRSIASSPNGAVNMTVAETNGVRCYVWEDNELVSAGGLPQFPAGFGNALYYALVNTTTNTIFETGQVDRNTPGYQPHLITRGSVFCLFWVNGQTGSPHNLYAATLPTSPLGGAPGWNATQTLITDFGNAGTVTGGAWDVAALVGGADTTHAMVVYEYTGSSPTIKIVPLTLSVGTWSTGMAAFVSPETHTGFVTLAVRWQQTGSNTTRLWVAYATAFTGGPGATLVRYQAFSATASGGSITALFNPVTIKSYAFSDAFGSQVTEIGIEDIGTASAPNPGALVVWGNSAGSGPGVPKYFGLAYAIVDTTGAVVLAAASYTELLLQSRPFAVACPTTVYGCRVYCLASDEITNASSLFVIELDVNNLFQALHPVATIAPRLARSGGVTSQYFHLSNVTNQGNLTAGLYVTAGSLTETSNIPSNYTVIGCHADFAHPGRFASTALSGLIYTGGGVPGSYDGSNYVESATLYPTAQDPQGSLTGHNTAGNLTTNTTYIYCFVPEWRDAEGLVAYGPPSAQYAIFVPGTGANTGSVTANVLSIAATQKGLGYRTTLFGAASLYLVPYRTTAGGTVLQRLIGDNPGSSYVNQAALPSISFTDTANDSAIAANPAIYTQGNILANDAPSSFVDICTHQGRVYGIGDDMRTIWISTAQTPGVPCTYSDGSQTMVSFLGDLTAIWSMDDKLFVASATGIAYMTGAGPNIFGQQSDLSPPVQLPCDVGVVDSRGKLVTPQGTIFRHAYGLGLLDRSLSVHSDFGDPVENELAGATVTGMQLHPTRPEILIFLTYPSVSGKELCYNYRFGAWATWKIHDSGRGGFKPMVPAASLVTGGLVYAATGSSGTVARECVPTDTLPYYDTVGNTNVAAVWITFTVQTGWIKPGGLQEEGRFLSAQTLFQVLDWSDMQVQFYYDYNDSRLSALQSFTANTISSFFEVNGSTNATTRVEFIPFQKRCESASMLINDAPPTGPNASTGQSFRVLGLAATVEDKGVTHRVPAAQRT